MRLTCAKATRQSIGGDSLFDCFSSATCKQTKRRRDSLCKKIATATTNPPEPPANLTDISGCQELSNICVFLHHTVQKFITKTDFNTLTTFNCCTKILQQLGVPIKIADTFQAETNENNKSDPGDFVIVSSPKYRILKNRAVAALATIADLGARSILKDSEDYRRGVTAAYQQASSIAVSFLEDIQKEAAVH